MVVAVSKCVPCVGGKMTDKMNTTLKKCVVVRMER